MSNSPIIWGPSNALNLTNGLTFTASTSGTLSLTLPSTVTTYSVVLPNAQGGATTTLINDGSGNLSWGTASAFITLGAFGSSPNANAASLSGSTLTLQPADGTHPGGISLNNQTMGAGTKTFSSAPIITPLPAQRIVYTSGISSLLADNNLIWDGASPGHMYINTGGSTGNATLDVQYSGGTAFGFSVTNKAAQSTTAGAIATLIQNNSSAMTTGNLLGQIFFAGFGSNTGTYLFYPGAKIVGTATENWASPSNGGSSLSFYVTPNATATSTLSLVLNNDASATFQSNVTVGVGSVQSNLTIAKGMATINSTFSGGSTQGLLVQGTLTATSSGVLQQGIVSQGNFAAATSQTVSVAASVYASPHLTGNIGTISTLAGFYFDGGSSNTGTVTNAYGVYCSNPAGASSSTNNYAAYFGGSVGINTTAPATALQVNNGSISLSNAFWVVNAFSTNNVEMTFDAYFSGLTTLANSTTSQFRFTKGSTTFEIDYAGTNTVGGTVTWLGPAFLVNTNGSIGINNTSSPRSYTALDSHNTSGLLNQQMLGDYLALGNTYSNNQAFIGFNLYLQSSTGGVNTWAPTYNPGQGILMTEDGGGNGNVRILGINWNGSTSTTGYTGMTDIMFLNYTGRVGLGTNVPAFQLTMLGTDSSATGPHFGVFTTADTTYPVYQALNYSHNNIALNFDSFWNGNWTSSYSPSNYQIWKVSNQLQTNFASGVTAGSTITWKNGTSLNTSGTFQVYNTLQTTGLAASWPQPQKNFLANPNFENGLSLAALLTVSLSGTTPTGAPTLGSASALTASVVTSGAISGVDSYQIVAASNWSAGQGIYMPTLTLDTAWQAKVLQVSFAYKVASGTVAMTGTSAGTFACWIYDVANSAWIQPSGVWNFIQSIGVGQLSATFQSPANATSFYICMFAINASGAALTMIVDDFYFGPIPTVTAPAMSDFVSYTSAISWNTNATATAKFRQEGDCIWCIVLISITGTPASGSLTVGIPPGYAIDTTKLIGTSSILSDGDGTSVGTGVFHMVCTYASTTTLNVSYINSGTNSNLGSVTPTLPIAWKNTDFINVQFQVPIVGLSSNAITSSSTDSRLSECNVYCSSSTSCLASNPTIIPYNTIVTDTHGMFNPGTNTATIPTAGYWYLMAGCDYGAQSTGIRELRLYVNGSLVRTFAYEGTPSGSVISYLFGQTAWSFNAGDTVQIKAWQTSVGSLTIGTGGSQYAWFTIAKQTGPALITAASTVTAFLTGTPTGTLNSSYNSISFPTVTTDSTGSYAAPNYTIPVSGPYAIQAQAQISGTYVATNVCNIAIFLNGSAILVGPATALASATYLLPVVSTQSYPLNAGDVITVRIQVTGSSPSFTASTGVNFFSITKQQR